jgi:hypothetical protein
MGCCLLVVMGALGPRVALVFTWIFTTLVDRAFNGFLMPLLGLVFVPWATLFFVIAYQPGPGVTGFGWVLVIFGLFMDIATYGSGGNANRRRALS